MSKKNKFSIDLEKLSDESTEIFQKRKEFILKAMKKKNNEFSTNDLIKYSKIWANIRYKGCRYSPKIYGIIRSLSNDLKRSVEDFIEENSDSENQSITL